jgi:preprotein translocase subunit SecE
MSKAMAIAQVQSDDDSRSLTQKAMGWPVRLKDYVQELQLEMHRVTWPNWKQVRATTLVVIAAVFGFAAYFFVVDQVIGRSITKLFDSMTR